ncbi:MAG: hypothetical protein R3A51_05600 [Nannocystaceae bacterium]|nr:hypothetical protein [Myxococcales bacterium]
MISDLRTRKLHHFFDVIDTNGDGVFTAHDTELVAEKIAALGRLAPGSAEHEAFLFGFNKYWEELRQRCDTSADGRVTREEWLAFHEVMLADPDAYAAIAESSAQLMFALVDDDHDGVIPIERYGEWMRAWGSADDESFPEIARRLDPDGAGALTRAQVLRYTHEFFYSEDPDAPGNWSLGRF